MKKVIRISSLLYLLLITGTLIAQRTLLINNVNIVDGSGKPSLQGAVRIKDSIIIAVGKLSPLQTDSVINGNGLTLTPGFIDTHSHHYGDLDTHPESIATNSQGITTIVIGQDGESETMDSIRSFLKRKPVAVNIATYTGHSTLREKVLGLSNLNRPATLAEQHRMQTMLAAEMKKGSLGLSTGLEYEAAFFSSTDEVVALAKTAARYKGRYTSHIRSEDVTLDEAVNELLYIGKVTGMPIQFSHIKIGLKDKWGQSSSILKRLDSARSAGIRITADVYPYDFWSSTLKVLFPDKNYASIASAQFATEHLFDPRQSVLVRYAPEIAYVGKTLSAIAQTRSTNEASTLIELIRLANLFRADHPNFSGGVEAIAAKAMSAEDVHQFVGWDQANLCSDGRAGGHPRGYGAFTKMLRVYVRERKQLTLEQAIYKMTALSAEHAGIKKRGMIAPGYYADLVLLDPLTVADQADLANATSLSIGIQSVWINGRMTYSAKNGSLGAARSGILLPR